MRKIVIFFSLTFWLLAFEYKDCCQEIAEINLHQKELPKLSINTLDTYIEYHAIGDEIVFPILEIQKKKKESTEE